MAFNLSSKITLILENNIEKKFTAREIALWILETYPNECKQKKERSTAIVNPLDNDMALIQQIVAEIGSRRPRLQKLNPHIKSTEGRPRQYYYTNASDSAEICQVENTNLEKGAVECNKKLKEYDLYPILSDFLRSEFSVYSKRIDEKRSSNFQGAGGNRWLHADLVGLENLSEDWHHEVKTSVQKHGDKITKLWSFEVKVLINRSNVREAFFQCVSNSSWANFGYLVASEIVGMDTLKELRMLSSLHGIGFIRLDVENPSESQVIIQAKERNEIDWNIVNRLAEENADFLEYIKVVRQFYQTGEIRVIDWDAV